MLALVAWPIFPSLGAAQAIQVPIALTSTAAFASLRPGTIDWALALALSAGIAPCVAIGVGIAHRVPAARLKLVVATVLVVSSAVLIVKFVLERL
jgi:uncharacterized membrane protein YfcA